MANTTADKLDYLNGTKEQLKTNLIEKGVTVVDGTTFRQMAESVINIKSQQSAKVSVEFYDVTSQQSIVYIDTDGDFSRNITNSNFELATLTPGIIFVNRTSENVSIVVNGDAQNKITSNKLYDVIYIFGDCSVSFYQF